jgi:cytochrome c biogenesis protein CcmG, thiol:disulfide interchange protein DsbE
MRKALAVVPLLLFALLAWLFIYGLDRDDPNLVKTGMTGKPVPQFALADLTGLSNGLGTPSLKTGGDGVVLVNFFASWCAPCRVEHAQLVALARDHGVEVVGIAYKDAPEATKRFLAELGNPYRTLGTDRDGRVAIEFGVTGVPETFIVRKRDGVIGFRHAGPILPEHVTARILPIAKDLAGAAS